MELRLAHGRDNPEVDMDEWGYEGPTLLNVDSIHEIYKHITTIRFISKDAREAARYLTGWPTWDETTLEMLRHDDLVETQEQSAPPRFYGDLFLYKHDSTAELTEINGRVQCAKRNLQKALDSLPRIM
jgi:hypothetical protein